LREHFEFKVNRPLIHLKPLTRFLLVGILAMYSITVILYYEVDINRYFGTERTAPFEQTSEKFRASIDCRDKLQVLENESCITHWLRS
jgi:hypothetical protein